MGPSVNELLVNELILYFSTEKMIKISALNVKKTLLTLRGWALHVYPIRDFLKLK